MYSNFLLDVFGPALIYLQVPSRLGCNTVEPDQGAFVSEVTVWKIYAVTGVSCGMLLKRSPTLALHVWSHFSHRYGRKSQQ